MKPLQHAVLLHATAFVSAICPVHAAPITWGSAVNVGTGVGNSSDVSTNGTLVEAYNAQAGGEAGINTTNPVVNGVTFVNTTALLPSTLGSGDPEMSTGTNGGDASYDALLSDAEFGGGTSTTITLGEGDGNGTADGGGLLEVGELYEIQVWFVDDRTNEDSRVMDYSTASGPTVSLNDQFAIGTFTADGTTQDLTLTTQGFGNTHLTAYQIRKVSSGGPGITWGTPVAVGTGAGNSSDVSTNGTLVEAYNASISSYTDGDQTVNGVTFVATTSLLPSDNGAGIEFSTGTNGGDAAYDAILSTADFGGGDSTTITLGEGDGNGTADGGGLLELGALYEIQVWFVDDRSSFDTRTMGYASSASDPVVNVNDQYVIGTFTADTTTRDLYLDTVSPASGFGNCHLTAYQIRKISLGPVPTLSGAPAIVSGPFTVDVTFSEPVSGLEESDFAVGNGSVTPASLAGSGASWSIEVTPAANGGVTVTLPAGTVIDLDGDNDPNVASNTLVTTYIAPGSDQPAVTLSTPANPAAGPYTVDVVFTEPVTGLDAADFDVTEGSASGLAGSGTTYSVLITPVAEGDVTVVLPAGSATDLDGDGLTNTVSNTLVTTVQTPDIPTVTIHGNLATESPGFEVFLSFAEDVTGLEDGDFQVVNGVASGTVGSGRFWSATITASAPGTVQVTLPAGSVTDLDGDNVTNPASNTHVVTCTSDFGERWIIDDQASWTANTGTASNLSIAGGFAQPTATSAQFTSITKSFPAKKKAVALTLAQSPVWDNWSNVSNLGPSGAGDAPVLVPVADNNYYFLGLGNTGGYHAWHSTDMINWTQRGPVTPPTTGRWVTSAEYKDGEFYIYSDYFNDHTPRLFKDSDLDDGVPGTDMGPAFTKATSGSDCSLIRSDDDGLFHLIYEDWSPINASTHSWDSPFAGHTSSADGLTGFVAHEHQPPVDQRTTPTGTFGTYNHPNVPNISYEIHTPEQDAFGDWTSIKIGSRFYLFGDYDQSGGGIKVARFTSDSIYKQYELVGSLGGGHPDPTVGFAEGQFYLITQRSTDHVSPGPWVDGVEARAGVDVDGNGSIDQWTGWQTVSERYDHTPGFIRVVSLTPARLDLSPLPAGHGFQYEFRVDDTVVAGVSPIMDRVEMTFAPSNFQLWANGLGIPAVATDDHNGNALPNLVEFAIGQSSVPDRQADGTLTLTATSGALADGLTVQLQFSENLAEWTPATMETTGVELLTSTTLGNGDEEMLFSIQAPNGHSVFWRIAVF